MWLGSCQAYERAGRPLPLGGFLVLIYFSGCVYPRAIVQLEGLSKLKNLMILSVTVLATFRCLNKRRSRAPEVGPVLS
jgi:hypothetical protein